MRYRCLIILCLLIPIKSLSAEEPSRPFSVEVRQTYSRHRILGWEGFGYVNTDYRFSFGMILEAGTGMEFQSGGSGGYQTGIMTPSFLTGFRVCGRLIDRVYPDLDRGYLSYLLWLQYENTLAGRKSGRFRLLLLNAFGINFHFTRSGKNIYLPFPRENEFTIISWVYLDLTFRFPKPHLDMVFSLFNFTRNEADFINDFTIELTTGWNFAPGLSLFFATGISPAGNFYLAGTWHTYYFSGGAELCF